MFVVALTRHREPEVDLSSGIRTRKRHVSLSDIMHKAQARIDEFGEDETKKKPKPKRVKIVQVIAIRFVLLKKILTKNACRMALHWLLKQFQVPLIPPQIQKGMRITLESINQLLTYHTNLLINNTS